MPTSAQHIKYWFILGRESQISAAEIDAVLNFKKYNFVAPILKIETTVLDSAKLIRQLGGTIKIAKEMADNLSEAELEQSIIEELKTVPGKINFGLSIYSTDKNDYANLKLAENLGKKIKKVLKSEEFSVRYVENREPILSSVTVQKNNLTGRGREFLIEKGAYPPVPNGYVRAGNTFSLAKTEAIQPFEEFSARDFGRPGRDDVSGMLPPKLAMMMINLAKVSTDATILDPFCGSGTILSEALLLGYAKLIGTDISEKAINDTRQNISWIAQQFNIPDNQFNITLETKKVEEINTVVSPKSIEAIVAEPYMGKPLKGNEPKEDLFRQALELKKLYLSAFAQFHKFLKPKGKVVFLIPRFKWQSEWITIDCKKDIEGLGFKLLPYFEEKMPLIYARPEQRVAREIWRWEKK
ncbi:MAG: hypothetical protein A2563_00110 [Candidatus Magasanikbacteria bacterium RIFOXYD1_FULL_40_23]|uniref:Ribosomal RNA large subunit methyltransferase K/L-like methyltransferase domain-containing protein n=1 Tax=Candidatus Magasanikbacteria bacterium RIFOXYD1_FULL_40_23 TaxID=1798705 RepID=A0A1F6P7V1_9BACT|nr:MAG: hypothetical protein A2563_00110 [Candidatus Magasanikbacteria bacterium RIFOXYD1_FULL_40_23]